MSYKPILFSTAMVQAILAGQKTQTRRVIKPQPSSGVRKSVFVKSGIEDGHGREIKPKYQPGDILWVRETWAEYECEKCRAGIPALGGKCICNYVYRTNYGKTEDDSFPPSMFKWRPSIFMPRAAARIFLRVTEVRAERLQDITEEDARAEGVLWERARKINQLETSDSIYDNAKALFMRLWDSLNAKRGYGWDTNPWVWVISFERCEKPEVQ